MGITTALTAPEPIQFLILLIQEGLVVGGLLVVDLLVEVLGGDSSFRQTSASSTPPKVFLRNFILASAWAISCMVCIGDYSRRRR